jgi:hypothetical protein
MPRGKSHIIQIRRIQAWINWRRQLSKRYNIRYRHKWFYELFTLYFLVAKENITKTFLRFCQGQTRHPFGTKDTADGPARRGQPITTHPLLNTNQPTPHFTDTTNKQTNKQTIV